MRESPSQGLPLATLENRLLDSIDFGFGQALPYLFISCRFVPMKGKKNIEVDFGKTCKKYPENKNIQKWHLQGEGVTHKKGAELALGCFVHQLANFDHLAL